MVMKKLNKLSEEEWVTPEERDERSSILPDRL